MNAGMEAHCLFGKQAAIVGIREVMHGERAFQQAVHNGGVSCIIAVPRSNALQLRKRAVEQADASVSVPLRLAEVKRC